MGGARSQVRGRARHRCGKRGRQTRGGRLVVGYTPTVVAGFWFGFDTPKALSGDASGGRLAAPAWAEFYTKGWREVVSKGSWRAPAGMMPSVIDPETGELAGEWCPLSQKEWYKPGTEPTTYCRGHFEPEMEDDEFSDRIADAFRRIFRY